MNMKIKYIILIAILLSQLIAGCKKSDWFDVKSDASLTVPATLDDFEYLMDDIITMNQGTPGLAEVGSDGHYLPENRWASLQTNSERNAYIWSNNFSNLQVRDWNDSYKRIFQCNLVLDGLKKLQPSANSLRYNSIKGNALFHRAKNYYDLAQIYAQPYEHSSADSDIGIPLKDGIDITEPAERASVKLTYEQIIADLTRATNLLPALPELKTRGSKGGAFALLARTYLVMNDFINAGLFADSSLRIYNKLIDFNSISPTSTNLGRFNLETIFFANVNNDLFSIWFPATVYIDADFYSLYELNDLRKTRFFTVSGGNIVFKGNYSNNAICFNGLAVDEQYLIRAECYARAGNTLSAMKDLNDLLKTRWNNAVNYSVRTAADAEDALRQILLERRKELLFRNLRWTDLRRLNLDTRFKVTLTRTIDGKTYTLEPGSYKYTLPIPTDVLQLAPLMKQTPGWE